MSHLRAGQIWNRARMALRRAAWERMSARIDARYRRRAASVGPARWDHPGLARVAGLRSGRKSDAARRLVAADALVGRFRFLERTEDLGREVAWLRPDLDRGTRLWKTMLHEFPYAEDLARVARDQDDSRCRARLSELVASWDAITPIGMPGFARDVWNARAVATRIVNLAVAASIVGVQPGDPDAVRLDGLLARHALFLRDNLEWDLRANHLIRDLVGLVFAGELFGSFSDGIPLLHEQVEEQILTDGCHVERAPMYHTIVLQDLVEVCALLGDRSPAWLTAAVARMAAFLENIVHGDSDLPLFGDCWRNEVNPGRLIAEAREVVGGELPRERKIDGDSGLVVLRSGENHAVLRGGAHGPDYQLGHAHADLLSFELSRAGVRVVTDTGTSTYDSGPERSYLRSTTAHNTLTVDDVEQLEAWGSFRVGRRGRARIERSGESGGFRWVWASHDAYGRLPGAPSHHRVLAVSDRTVLVVDEVRGSGRHRIKNRLHLHPDASSAEVEAICLDGPAVRVEAPLHERFGETRPMTRLCREAETELPWVGGWLVRFDSRSGAGSQSSVERDSGGVRVVHRDGEVLLEALWNPRAAQPAEAFRIVAVPSAGNVKT